MGEVLFFASDLTETAQLRRIRSIRALGHAVRSVSMRKPGAILTDPPDWPDLSLGQIANERLARRIGLGLAGLLPVWRARHRLRQADVIVARNLDMAALALAARVLIGRPRLPVIYECLDIHGVLTAVGAKGRFARALERAVLARSALLVTSSPGFLRQYFGPVQGYGGPATLLENKIWFPGPPIPRALPGPPRGGLPVIGWVGAIRCAPSLDLLCAAAQALEGRATVLIRGVIHDHALPGFAQRIARHPNIRYAGPYRWPDGLAEVYAGCDLVWAQDLWQGGANSDWLLPNRIYEAGWFGCPSVGVAGTETGAKIAAEGLGFVLPEATPQALVALISGLSPADVATARRALLARPDSAFRLMAAELEALLSRAGLAPA